MRDRLKSNKLERGYREANGDPRVVVPARK